MRMRYPRHLNIGPADNPEGSSELSLNKGKSNWILA